MSRYNHMVNKLPEDITNEIKKEANNIYWQIHKISTVRDPYCRGLTMFEVAQTPIINALTEWRVKYDELKKEADDLKRWKREASEILAPIISYAQGHQDAILGHSCTGFVIERCKDYDRLKDKAEKMEAALRAWVELDNMNKGDSFINGFELQTNALKLTDEALAWKETKEETDPCSNFGKEVDDTCRCILPNWNAYTGKCLTCGKQ